MKLNPELMALHTPVLLKESLTYLGVCPGGDYIDATVGDGGHAAAILAASAPGGRLLGIDLDPQAVARAQQRLAGFGRRATLAQDNFRELRPIATEHGFRLVDGILFDLGVSSLQLENGGRGFSFQRDGPLDMRFDPAQTLTAAEIVNTWPQAALATLLRRYGEERHSHRLARAIVSARPFTSTLQLAQVIAAVVNGSGGTSPRRVFDIHPATRSFQALRIAVNQELESLEAALSQAVELLRPGGRLVVIAFHSLEDRLVKQTIRQESHGCPCANEAHCHCHHRPRLGRLTKKVITPSPEEQAANPRSRSARLRAAERLPNMENSDPRQQASFA